MVYNILEEVNPKVLQDATDLLSLYNDTTYTKKEEDHIFVEAALFADYAKFGLFTWNKNYHFVRNALLDEGDSIENYK